MLCLPYSIIPAILYRGNSIKVSAIDFDSIYSCSIQDCPAILIQIEGIWKMKIFEKFDKLNNTQKHIIKFSIGFVCFITLVASLVLSYLGIVLPVKIICGMFVFFILSFMVYIIWDIAGYDNWRTSRLTTKICYWIQRIVDKNY